MNNASKNRLSFDNYLNSEIGIGLTKNSLSEFPMHWHNYFEYELMVEGEAIHELNGEKYHVGVGDAWIVTPTDFHRITSKKNFTLFNVSFNENTVHTNLLKKSILFIPQKIAHFTDEDLNFSLVILEKMLGNYNTTYQSTDFKKAYYKNLVNSLLFQFGATINKEPKKIIDPSKIQSGNSITKALLYLQIHFNENPSLQQVSRFVGHNKNYFCELFYRQTGMHYSEYLRSLKLDYSKNLLLYSDLSVTEICYASGFTNFSAFLRDFKNGVGVTPTQFRKTMNFPS